MSSVPPSNLFPALCASVQGAGAPADRPPAPGDGGDAEEWVAGVQAAGALRTAAAPGQCAATGRLHAPDIAAPNPSAARCGVCVDEARPPGWGEGMSVDG